MSCGALPDAMHLVELARTHGGRILLPTGALLGIDAVLAASHGTIHTVRTITRMPPKSLLGAPYLVEHGIELSWLTEKIREPQARVTLAFRPALATARLIDGRITAGAEVWPAPYSLTNAL